MHYYEVAPTKIIRAGSDTFTYSSEQPLSIGTIVEIEVGKRITPGVICIEVSKPTYATKPIGDPIEFTPLPRSLVELAIWMSQYYATPLATVLQTLLPRGLTVKRRATIPKASRESTRKRTNFVLTKAQQAALTSLNNTHETALLHGVTGSGKTAVYIEQAKRTIAAGKSVVILVPEIALTSQLVDEFTWHFDDVLLTHSRQTESERHQTWQSALHAKQPQIVIGPRSALFLPLGDIGLIVVDECHEPSFQQEQAPRYSALRVASKYAQLTSGLCILGSATPSLADYYLAAPSDSIISMDTPARKDTVKPTVAIVDMTKRPHFTRHRFLSNQLLNELETTFASGAQALIFHNRRGSASTTLCEQCGWQAGCPRCFLPLTLHTDTHVLRCHVCGFHDTVPTSCPVCGSVDVIHKGIGTKLIEQEMKKLFPSRSIARFDGDNTDDTSVETRYKELYDGTIDMIIGTQVVAKGLDLPNLRTVGVIQADAGLSLPDFGASERTFQLLAQVVGRVGRSHHATKVIIQSYQPAHPAVTTGIHQDYQTFYTQTLKERHRAMFPPFVFLLKLTCVYKTEAAAIRNAGLLAKTLKSSSDQLEILGPTPSFYERQHDTYRWQLVVKATKRQHLIDILPLVPASHWRIELDPISLL